MVSTNDQLWLISLLREINTITKVSYHTKTIFATRMRRQKHIRFIKVNNLYDSYIIIYMFDIYSSTSYFKIILYASQNHKIKGFEWLDVENKKVTWSENDFEHDLNLPSTAVREKLSNLSEVYGVTSHTALYWPQSTFILFPGVVSSSQLRPNLVQAWA